MKPQYQSVAAMVAGPEGLPAPLFCKDNSAFGGKLTFVARQWDGQRGGTQEIDDAS
jgi:hypothetical protein